ncbi:hypothetical protein EVAR_58844_1 [Eumeta japonica]|uniref:Uncharacterized protein n=1 Tax=Eumeta variegata TaxID=151549 RepID=A0A4C1Y773_EUMVA|nr:hypothetical protein EVAR_58844_1 [Eumeta japonica]
MLRFVISQNIILGRNVLLKRGFTRDCRKILTWPPRTRRAGGAQGARRAARLLYRYYSNHFRPSADDGEESRVHDPRRTAGPRADAPARRVRARVPPRGASKPASRPNGVPARVELRLVAESQLKARKKEESRIGSRFRIKSGTRIEIKNGPGGANLCEEGIKIERETGIEIYIDPGKRIRNSIYVHANGAAGISYRVRHPRVKTEKRLPGN